MTSHIGTKIKELRLLSEMSQEELGRRVGVQRAAIQKYEKGSVTNIPIPTIEKIANVFDVSPTYIVGWNDDIFNKLSMEVRIITGVKRFFGVDAVNLLELYSKLNKTGQKKLLQYGEDIYRIYHKN